MITMRTFKTALFLGMLIGLSISIGACAPAAPVDASKARSRAVIQSGNIVSAEELRVAEYLSYYEQDFPEPVGTALGLDLRPGNPVLPVGGGEAWVQIGLQAKSAEAVDVAPLNLALVIDRSGSMDAPEKMPYVKQSIRAFLESLAVNDRVAIVIYNDRADLIVPAREVDDGGWIAAAVDRLNPSGRTNLYDGLMLGFREVDRRFDVRRNNRVILLTDGIANVGVTDADRIAADTLAYNERGIHLSTIGLGQEFNDALLSQLAIQGKGAYHFIDSAEEMDRVFRDEPLGLIQKAAGEVSIVFRLGEGVRLVALTGYEGEPPAGPVQVRLRDTGTGESQVLLARLQADPGRTGQRVLATVELRYTDLFAQRQETITLPVYVDVSTASGYDPLWDLEVLRNVTIQRTAEGLREIDQLYQAQRYQAAWDVAYQLEQRLREVARLTGEEQMAKDADLMRSYQATLARWAETQTGRPPLSLEQPEPTRFYRRREVATPAVPVIEVK